MLMKKKPNQTDCLCLSCWCVCVSPNTFVPRMICLSPGTKREHRAYSQPMVRITCRVDLSRGGEDFLLAHSHVRKNIPGPAGTEAASPVPHFDSVTGGREHGQVVWAEGQRADVGAVAAEREAGRLISCGGGGLVWSPQAVGLHCVVLQQQRHLQLAASTWQTFHPSERGRRRREWSTSTAEPLLPSSSSHWPDLGWGLDVGQSDDLVLQHPLHHRLCFLLARLFLSSTAGGSNSTSLNTQTLNPH